MAEHFAVANAFPILLDGLPIPNYWHFPRYYWRLANHFVEKQDIAFAIHAFSDMPDFSAGFPTHS
ncbi:MAG: hypothetical protein NTW32_00610 [Chloroflexi bacterium]|nr:hypothetical protein [Chloroflexota bacterium]